MNIESPLDEISKKKVSEILVLTQPITQDFLDRALINVQLFDRKQTDYGSRNISDFGLPGVIVRMNDKWQRIINLTKGGRRKRARNESLRDSFNDISNYALIATLLIDNKWPQP